MWSTSQFAWARMPNRSCCGSCNSPSGPFSSPASPSSDASTHTLCQASVASPWLRSQPRLGSLQRLSTVFGEVPALHPPTYSPLHLSCRYQLPLGQRHLPRSEAFSTFRVPFWSVSPFPIPTCRNFIHPSISILFEVFAFSSHVNFPGLLRPQT